MVLNEWFQSAGGDRGCDGGVLPSLKYGVDEKYVGHTQYLKHGLKLYNHFLG